MPDIERAAQIIYDCWKSGGTIDYSISDLWPDTVEQGYAVQAALNSGDSFSRSCAYQCGSPIGGSFV